MHILLFLDSHKFRPHGSPGSLKAPQGSRFGGVWGAKMAPAGAIPHITL